jgi:hypothetical protein
MGIMLSLFADIKLDIFAAVTRGELAGVRERLRFACLTPDERGELENALADKAALLEAPTNFVLN